MAQPSSQENEKVLSLLQEAYLIRVSDLKKSIELSMEALQISRSIVNIELIGKSLNQLALFYMIQGEQKLSIQSAEEAITHFEILNDDIGIANAKYAIASIYYKSDNYHLGLVNLVDCLAIYRKHDDYHNQSRTLKSLGTIYEYFGDQKKAIQAYEDAIEAAIKAKDKNLESNAYNPLSGIYLNQHKVAKALNLIEKSIRMKNETGDIRGLAFAYYGRGKVHIQKKHYQEAEQDFNESIRIHLEMGERLGIAMTYYKLGCLYILTKQKEKAKEIIQVALEISNQFNIAIIKFKCNFLLYEIYKKEKELSKALEYLEAYLKVREAVINTQTLKIIENYELITKMESLKLEAQLQKEKAEIIEKTNRAEQAAKVKQEFLSTMSHEIRTPLNAVITIATLLEEKADPEENKLLQSLNFAAANLLMIINDILDFTKLDSGKVKLEFSPSHFINLMKNIRNTYQNLAIDKNLELTLNIEPLVAESYEIDATKFSQILGNLITNAIKYTNKGKVEINVNLLTKEDEFDVLKFEVRDTGVGIPKKYLEEIFDSFSQPKSITTRTQGGTGLGLAIVKQLIHLFESEILVESKEGKGSIFSFELKLKRSTITLKRAENISTQLSGKIVLIVDDNMINAMVASKLISKWGLVSDHAVNGQEAVSKASQNKYDFILMDIHMPIMDGYEATTMIRKSKGINNATPIFAFTADITAENQEEFTSYFQGFLRKPIEVEKLREALVNALN